MNLKRIFLLRYSFKYKTMEGKGWMTRLMDYYSYSTTFKQEQMS